MTWGCLLAARFGLCAFIVACCALYQAIVNGADQERWRNMRDHPSTRNRRPLGPEDDDDWDRL